MSDVISQAGRPTAFGISVVKNEADVIESMVRHNVQFLDKLRIVDNGSADGTYEILCALRDEGLPLEVFQDGRGGHIQDRIMTHTASRAGRWRQGYIFFLDADEFIFSTLDQFRSFLSSGPNSFRMPWITYVPVASDDASILNPAKRIVHRRDLETRKVYKAVLGPEVKGRVRVSKGSHNLGDGVALQDAGPLQLAHFPVRTPQQLAAKALLGSWEIKLRGRKPLEAYQWFTIARQIRRNGPIAQDRLTDIATMYATPHRANLVYDPLFSPIPYELRYTKNSEDILVSRLIEFADKAVEQLILARSAAAD